MPFGTAELHTQLTALLENCRAGGGHSAEGVLTLALAMMENTACPHADCPLLMLDEHQHRA